MADTLASATGKGCITIIGGGDSVAAVEQVKDYSMGENVYYFIW